MAAEVKEEREGKEGGEGEEVEGGGGGGVGTFKGAVFDAYLHFRTGFVRSLNLLESP